MILIEVISTSERKTRTGEGTENDKMRKVYVQREIKLAKMKNLEDMIRKIREIHSAMKGTKMKRE